MTTNTSELLTTLQKLDKSTITNAVERQQIASALFATLRRLQEPAEIALTQGWIEPAITAVIQTLINLDFWRRWQTAGWKESSSTELAGLINVEPIVLKRMLRFLAVQHLVEQTGDGDTYAATDFTRSLTTELYPAVYAFLYKFNQPCFANFPKFMAETNYKNPLDSVHSNPSNWLGEGKNLFTVFAENPEMQDAFNKAMTFTSQMLVHWSEIYPTDIIIEDAKEGCVLVVDIGGGVGHDLEIFREKYPDVPKGSLILQDLPRVIERAVVKEPVVAQIHDFTKPQSVKGAHIYYLHRVLHDWEDGPAVEILKNIVPALDRGYSKILLHEYVIADQRPNAGALWNDMAMMMSVSSAEREERAWRDLAEQAGLRLTRIWSQLLASECIIELELP